MLCYHEVVVTCSQGQAHKNTQVASRCHYLLQSCLLLIVRHRHESSVASIQLSTTYQHLQQQWIDGQWLTIVPQQKQEASSCATVPRVVSKPSQLKYCHTCLTSIFGRRQLTLMGCNEAFADEWAAGVIAAAMKRCSLFCSNSLYD